MGSKFLLGFGREGHDDDRIDSVKLGLRERLAEATGNIETLADLERFIALRAKLQITPGTADAS
jgi:hypothetical protein